jgi:aspartyl-tRNA(Asn)/glutamyl-tRNA(Gln) amidotransferase subunit C
MKKEDIEHLAKLSRIALTDAEKDALAGDITNILSYVSDIEKVTGKSAGEKKVGSLYNVMREDENPHEPGIYTEALLKLAPERDGQYIKVKKIIGDKS